MMLALGAAGCVVNPATGKQQLSLVSEAEEIQLGRTEAAKIPSQIGIYEDTAVQAYVSRIGRSLALASERPDLPWSFQVVDDPGVNAFALPGGFIFVTRGILGTLNSEAELAAVIGHEIGHVTARHSVQAISRAQLAQFGLGVGSIFSSTVRNVGDLASSGLGILFLKYGRDAEDEADALGFRYALKDGYDVREMTNVFRTLEAVSAQGGGSKVPQWLSTHPDPTNRAEKNQRRLAALTQDLSGTTRNRNAYLKQIDGLVYGADPRQGYFDGDRFYHPTLRLQMDLPSGWQRANQPQSVVAVSPNQDALFELTAVQNARTAQEAYRAFAAEQGVNAGASRTGRQGGLATVRGAFQSAASDGTTLRGEVFFVELRGAVYRLLGYGTAAGYQRAAGTFSAVFASFGEVIDRAVLARQPARVHLVRVPRAMTLRAFAEQYPSTIAVEEVALINGATVDATLDANSTAKRVQ